MNDVEVYVTYKRDGKVGRVTISRPKALNALNDIVVKQLDKAFQEAESDPETNAIILEATGGKAFVAGADIGFFINCIKEDRLDDNLAFTSYGQEVLNRIDNCRKLVVAKMEGMALGGGLELALSADVMVSTPKPIMGFPETSIGIYPGLGGTQRSSRAVGKELAKYLLFTCRLVSAEEAFAIGLVDYVFAPEEIEEKMMSMISEGKLVPNKGRKTEDLPEEWRKIKELFVDKNIDGLLSGKFLENEDPLIAKTAKIISRNAPIALKLANEIVDKGFDMPVSEAVKQELVHLKEIFATADALTG
ncbi:MAG: enoyl-CoA hydratase/isomerase family protein, partial [Deltaproteobacteria bacterium]|nr:enoyl-CoA hydratase/isomerase family protein [Deltaproteobacteria bacterium]